MRSNFKPRSRRLFDSGATLPTPTLAPDTYWAVLLTQRILGRTSAGHLGLSLLLQRLGRGIRGTG